MLALLRLALLPLASALALPEFNSLSIPSNVPANETQLYPPYSYVSSSNYIPQAGGIPITSPNTTITPWDPVTRHSPLVVAAVQLTCTALAPTNPSTFWYESITHNGRSPFIANGASWPVFRNVKSGYGARGDGVTDDTAAIVNAIKAGNGAGDRSQHVFGTTGQPAVVYLPAGTYIISSPLQLYVDTVIMGNPLSPPIIKASSSFSGNTLIYGKDPHLDSTINFYIGIKNLVLDSTNIAPSTTFTLLDWSVSQATQLTNVVFNMPNFSTGHTGIAMPEGGSGTIMNDLTINGGVIGINFSNQQYILKGISFSGCTTGIKVSGCFDCVFQGLSFQYNAVAIDMTAGGIGSVIVLDSTASNIGTFVATDVENSGANSLVIENFSAGAGVTNTVTASGTTILTGSVPQTWVYGNAYVHNGPTTGAHQTGTTYTSSRASALLASNGKYQAISPPTYGQYDVTEFINVKTVPGFPVYGDGATDDTANLNYIASTYAGCKILFFPAGTYIVTNTIFFPAGSRVVGEAWSAISATGSNFYNPSAPVPMVKVGNAGDIGVAQFSDFLFTVADVLQGCTLLEVNIAGNSPGDVGFWNTHFRVGGAAGSKVETNCGGAPVSCRAAYMLLHLTSTSSAYIENMWGWTADHDLDGGNGQTISTGRGMLVEATKATWLVGTAFEHNTLYQYNLNNARNVYIGMQQSETPYWQGNGSPSLAPAPWTAAGSDPTFSNCGSTDGQCRMAWFQIISGSSSIYVYGSGFWTFFENGSSSCGSVCQTNAVDITSTSALFYYGLNTRSNVNVVYYNGSPLVTQNNNPGGWGAVVAAFLWDT